MNQTPEPLAVTRHQAAQMVNISVTEIDDERRAGRLVARKHGRKVLIEVSELRRWVEALPSDDMRFAPEPDSGAVLAPGDRRRRPSPSTTCLPTR